MKCGYWSNDTLVSPLDKVALGRIPDAGFGHSAAATGRTDIQVPQVDMGS